MMRATPIFALLLAFATSAGAQETHPGKVVYDRWCAGCHAVDGTGTGPAADRMIPRPRDFTRALYQVRNTPSGALPTDENMLHVVNVGMPGTAMPGWEGKLTEQQRTDVVEYLKTFSRFFESEAPAEPIAIDEAPGVTEEGLAEGRELYERIECFTCHGQLGRGDGTSAPELEDEGGFPIAAADLTEPWSFNGGSTVEDIYARLRTGLDGTPMPSFSDLLESGFMTDAQLWNLAHYVRSLGPAEAPEARDVFRAGLVEGALPATADDPAWDAVEPAYVPLVAQIVIKPRWFAPRVDGVWVQALHDGTDLVMRLTWNDPSRSPDPSWNLWQERLLAAMGPDEGGVTAPGSYPDAFAVQFPRQVPEGRELPYFLMGTSREPVYLWRWESEPDRAYEATARGLGQWEALPADLQAVTAAAAYADGQWRLLLRRSLATADSTDRIQFSSGEPIPVAFFAWDGSNGETGTQGSVSSWYYVHLDQPGSSTVFVVPVAATLFTLALGLVVVARAQRRGRPSDDSAQDQL